MLDITTNFRGWYDPTHPKKKPLQMKVREAAGRYVEVRGEEPNAALVNAEQLGEEPVRIEGMEVEGANYIARNTVYVGRR